MFNVKEQASALVEYSKKCLDYVHQHWYPTVDKKMLCSQIVTGIIGGIGLQKFDELYENLLQKGVKEANLLKFKKILPLEAIKQSLITNAASVKITPRVIRDTIAVPPMEEILYRGYLREDRDSDKPALANMVITSSLFAATHFKNKQSLKMMPFYFLAGCVLWEMAEKSNNLIASTTAHSTKNLLTHRAIQRGSMRAGTSKSRQLEL